MPAFDPVSLGIQSAAGLAQTTVGLINAAKAKKEAKQLARSRPKYAIPDDAQRELDLSESELGTGGLSARAENAYNQLNNRQFSSSLDATLRMGGSPSQVSDIFDSSEAGRLRLAELNDQMRLQKIQNLISSRRYMNEQKDKQFEFNEWMPFADRMKANEESRQGAEEMIWSGIGTLGGAGVNAGTQAFNSNMWDDYLNPRNKQPKMFGGSGTTAQGYGNLVDRQLNQPRTRLTLGQ